MAKSLNRVTLIGNLGQDPELRTIPSGMMVCTVSLATTESYKDKTTGEWKETTDWHRVVLWDNLAKLAGDYLKKGSKVYIEGRIKYGTFEGKDGQTRYTTDIVASSLIMMSKDSSGGSNSSNYDPNFSQSAGASIVEQLAGHLTPDIDDDIPF